MGNWNEYAHYSGWNETEYAVVPKMVYDAVYRNFEPLFEECRLCGAHGDITEPCHKCGCNRTNQE